MNHFLNDIQRVGDYSCGQLHYRSIENSWFSWRKVVVLHFHGNDIFCLLSYTTNHWTPHRASLVQLKCCCTILSPDPLFCPQYSSNHFFSLFMLLHPSSFSFFDFWLPSLSFLISSLPDFFWPNVSSLFSLSFYLVSQPPCTFHLFPTNFSLSINLFSFVSTTSIFLQPVFTLLSFILSPIWSDSTIPLCFLRKNSTTMNFNYLLFIQ